jgi:hypothetical protein
VLGFWCAIAVLWGDECDQVLGLARRAISLVFDCDRFMRRDDGDDDYLCLTLRSLRTKRPQPPL